MQLSNLAWPSILCQWRSTRKLLGGLLLATACQVPPAPSAQTKTSLTPPPNPAGEAAPKSNPWQFRTGPWGTLRLRELHLKAPLATLEKLTFTETRIWSFGTTPWPEIYAFLRQANLTDAQWTELSDPSRRLSGSNSPINGIHLSSDFLLSLSPESRRFIYDHLAKFPENSDHGLPIVLPDPAGDESLGLNPALLAALDKLSFYRDGKRCLTDAKLLEAFVADADELIRLKRFLVRTPSLTLEIARESLRQREETIRYWSHHQGKSSRNLLKILADSPDLAGLDIVHFLPPLPQAILNRFPDQDLPPSLNCFWTALNFFSRNPDHQFLPLYAEVNQAEQRALRVLESKFTPVDGSYEFGDVIALFTSPQIGGGPPELLHAVSYIADDIVMTKNGAADFKPIVLMSLDQVMALYAWPEGIEVRGYRQLPLPQQSVAPSLR